MSDGQDLSTKVGAPKQADKVSQIPAEKPLEKATEESSEASPEKKKKKKKDPSLKTIPTGTKQETLNRRKSQSKPSVDVKNNLSAESNDINLSIPRTRGKLRHTTMIPIPSVASLAGKKVDDSGNIVDEDGDVWGKATGIISDIAGKTVNEYGQVVDEQGNVLGKVGEISQRAVDLEKDEEKKSHENSHDAPDPVAGLVGRAVTDSGCILDDDGRIIGRVEGDITEMVGRTVSPNGDVLTEAGEVVGKVAENLLLAPEDDDPPEEILGDEHHPRNQKAKAEDKADGSGAASNAEADSGGDPTDIYLNIQSTKEAITITIRVPTVFRDKFNR